MDYDIKHMNHPLIATIPLNIKINPIKNPIKI